MGFKSLSECSYKPIAAPAANRTWPGVWQVAPDLPPGTKAARDLLLKDPVWLSDADRESPASFLS